MRRLTGLVPTLLLCAALPASALAGDAVATAVTPSERDNQFDAVKSLIDRDYRMPAKRQLADFEAAKYPESDAYLRALRWYYADRFRVISPDKAEKDALDKQAKELGPDLEKFARTDPKCPDIIKNLVGGTGKVLRLVNDILGLVDPDKPIDQSGITGIPDERKAAVNQAVLALAAEAKTSFDAAAAKIKANAKGEEEAVTKNDMKAIEGFTMARLEAIRPVALAHRALREIAERGAEFGVDPAPALKFLKEFAGANFKTLQDWDYAFGDYHPYLHAFLMEVAGDGVRFKIKDATFEDVEADTLKTVEGDAAHDFAGQPAVIEEIRTLQAKTWAGVFTWYRDLGRDVAPKYWQRGVEQWQAFKEKTRGDRHFRLDHPNHDRAVEVARAYIAAARLLLAKGDSNGAMAILNQVAAVKDQPLAPHARAWVQYVISPPGKSGSGEQADWGSVTVANDPAGAVDSARAYMNVANQTGDEAKAAQFRLRAALVLRAGVLGLENPADQARADEAAPELWFRYAGALNQMGQRWHAAVISLEGLKQIKARMAELPKDANVWKAKDGSWTKSGQYISKLSQNAITYAQLLLMRTRGSGVSNLYDAIVSQVNVISPADTGRSLDWLQVQVRLSESDWDGAIEAAKAYIKKYPEDVYKATSNGILVAMAGKRSQAKSADERKRIEADMTATAEALMAQAQKELAGPKADAARQKEIQSALLSVGLVKIQSASPDEQLTLLGPDFWKKGPNEELTLKAIKILCNAVREHFRAWEKDEKSSGDGKLLLANWERYQAAYETWHKQKTRLPTQSEAFEREGAKLAQTFVNIGNAAERLRAKPDAPAGLGAISKVAYKAFSDMIEPGLSEANKPELILATANILWDLNEHPRAARLYEIFLAQVKKDPDASALKDGPKAVLDPLDAVVGARPELKPAWVKLRDLLEDAPGLVDNILNQDLPPDKWGEQKIDYAKAVEAIQALRRDAKKRQIEIGAGYAQLDEGLAKLESAAGTLAREISCVAKLAVACREMGGDKADKATDYYNRLIAYDPTNPEYLAAAVELIIKQIKDGKALDEKVIQATQVKAARVRDAADPGSPTYWTAVTQVLELANVLKDTKAIDKRLIFDAQNRSTPADDLQMLPREPRDDKRVRRARNAISVDLCKRYLAVFQLPGISAKPSFRIDTIDIDGKETAIFVPVDAPKFAAQKRELEDGTTVWFVWEDGKTPPPEAAPEEKKPDAKAEAAKPDAPKPDAKPVEEKKP